MASLHVNKAIYGPENITELKKWNTLLPDIVYVTTSYMLLNIYTSYNMLLKYTLSVILLNIHTSYTSL